MNLDLVGTPRSASLCLTKCMLHTHLLMVTLFTTHPKQMKCMYRYIYAEGGRAHKTKFTGYISEEETGGTKLKRKFLQRRTSDKMLRTYRQLMAPLERLINSLDIRTEN